MHRIKPRHLDKTEAHSRLCELIFRWNRGEIEIDERGIIAMDFTADDNGSELFMDEENKLTLKKKGSV